MIKIFYFSIKEKTIIVKKFNKKFIIKRNQNLSFKKENKNQVAILDFKKNQKIYKNIFKYTIKLKTKKSKKIYYKILMGFTKPKYLNSFKFFFFIYKFLFYIRRYRKIFFLNIFLSNLKRIFKKKLNFNFLKLVLNFVKNYDKKKQKKIFFNIKKLCKFIYKSEAYKRLKKKVKKIIRHWKKPKIKKKKLKKKTVLKKTSKYKKIYIGFWKFFYNLKQCMFYNAKLHFKKYLIFNFFFKKFIFTKLKKKIFCKRLFKDFFWHLESRIDIFLIRNGFVKNLQQSCYVLKNKGVFLNNKIVLFNYFKINKFDIIQIYYYYLIFFKLFLKKSKNWLNKFYFIFNFLVKLKKYPFYIENNYKTNSCIIIFKPEPSFNSFTKKFLNFNFFFYKYLFYFIKKKTF